MNKTRNSISKYPSPTKGSPNKKRKDAILQMKEINQLCNDIGIDYQNEQEKYSNFLNKLQTDHPLDPSIWEKGLQKDGKMYYKNVKENKIVYSHPNIKVFREIFHGIYQNQLQQEITQNKSKINTNESPSKAEAKQVDKVEKISFEQMYDLKGRTKFLLESLRNRQEEILQSEDNNPLILLEKILQTSLKYYQQEYGDFLKRIPEKIEKSPQFQEKSKNIGPHSIVRNLQLLGIPPSDSFLFYFGKLFDIVELPPGWQKKYDSAENQSYFLCQTDDM